MMCSRSAGCWSKSELGVHLRERGLLDPSGFDWLDASGKLSPTMQTCHFFRATQPMADGILREACKMTERPFISSGASNSSRRSSANAPSECSTESTIFTGPSSGPIRQAPAPSPKRGATPRSNGLARNNRGHFLGRDDQNIAMNRAKATRPAPCRTSCPRWPWASRWRGHHPCSKRARWSDAGPGKRRSEEPEDTRIIPTSLAFTPARSRHCCGRGHAHAGDGFLGDRHNAAPQFPKRRGSSRLRNPIARPVRRW